ncbi:ATP12 family chaperone protein [Coralliovum pocilloporae]|uniref:ATP12 family chaperone protein n=1 Tax=Coralliovum pocilloporae TaxID=3066369 RepID=UPI0033076AE8
MRDLLDDLDAQREAFDPVKKAREVSKQELPKRFYKDVSCDCVEGQWRVLLDGRPVRTPSKTLLAVPHRTLADKLVEEWSAQVAHIDPATMPMTRLVNSTVDGVANRHDEVLDEMVRYAGTDCLCYRADAPDELVQRQTDTWDPVLDWAAGLLGHRFVLAGGIMHVEQSEELLASFRVEISGLDSFKLAAFASLTSAYGSAVLPLAVLKSHLSADRAWDVSRVEEDWNRELWGEDPEAQRLAAYRKAEVDVAGLILSVL